MPDKRDDSAEHKRIVEAALFVAGKAMSVDEIARTIGVMSMGYVKRVLDELADDYESRDGALMISRTGDKYALSIKNRYVEKVSSLAGAPEISRGALRILAYVSKNEPIMQSAVVKSFGSASYDYLRELREKEFIKAKREGRTKRLETTPKFREYFGL